MKGPDVFQSQLRPGERVLWNAPASAAVREAADRRLRRRMLSIALGGAALAGLGDWLAYENGRDLLTKPGVASAFDAVKMVVLTVLMLGVSVMGVRTLLRICSRHLTTPTWQSHYVLTDQRVFYVDETGELIDTIERHEIVAVELDEEVRPAAVLVERRTEDEEEKHLLLLDLEHPHIAKAKITETFLEPAP